MGRIFQLLDGGLGNQMFQYAFCYVLAKQNNKKLEILSLYNGMMPGSRENGLRFFSIPQKFNGNIPIHLLTEIMFCIVKRYVNLFLHTEYQTELKPRNSKIFTLEESEHKFLPGIVILDDQDCLVKGFWQSGLYFNQYRDELYELFTLRKRYLKKVKNRAEYEQIIQCDNPVSIHVRRGDFQKIGWMIDPEYYVKAIRYIRDKVKSPKFFVFSDDIEWCKNYFSDLENAVFVENTSAFSYEDMYLMSQCAHNIIANSTYSWWAGFLNRNIRKHVVVPQCICETTNADILSGLDWIAI